MRPVNLTSDALMINEIVDSNDFKAKVCSLTTAPEDMIGGNNLLLGYSIRLRLQQTHSVTVTQYVYIQ